MRFYAKQKGYHLSDKCLKLINSNDSKESEYGAVIKCYSELDIFNVLKIPYLEPSERASSIFSPVLEK